MRWDGRTALGLALAVSVLGGCRNEEEIPKEELRPVETSPRTEATPMGAYYELHSDQGTLGDAKVWWRSWDLGGPTPKAIVGFRLRNDADAPLSLVPEWTELEVKLGERPVWVIGPPTDIIGSPRVEPGETGRFELVFAMPEDVALADLRWLELNWTAGSGERRASYSTPFVRDQTRPKGKRPYWGYRPYAAYGYGYPYWGGYYGFGYPYYYYGAPMW